MNTAALQSLPPELSGLVTAILPMADLCNLRHTCREIEAGVYEDFTRRGYSSRTLRLTKDSTVYLKSLLKVFDGGQFSPAVRKLTIQLSGFSSVEEHSYWDMLRRCTELKATTPMMLLERPSATVTLTNLEDLTIVGHRVPRRSASTIEVPSVRCASAIPLKSLQVHSTLVTADNLMSLFRANGCLEILELKRVRIPSEIRFEIIKRMKALPLEKLYWEELGSGERSTEDFNRDIRFWG